MKDETISDLEIKEESDMYGIDQLKISFKIDDSDTFTLYIRLSNFVGANGIEFLSEEEIVREFEEKYSYLKGYLLGETIKERKINGYSNEIKSHIRVAKKMHEIYRVYFEKVRIKKFTTAYETVEFYLKQMEKQIRKMCEAYQENKNIENSFKKIEDMAINSDVITIGPGIGKSENSLQIMKKLLQYKKNTKGETIKLVIDADGLNLLSENPELFKEIENRAILTPHTMEFSRLSGFSLEEISEDKRKSFIKCKNFASEHGIILLLKGKNTLITDGTKVYINSTGNSHMANGGMGDGLTGIISSLAGQHYSLLESAKIGAFLHGYIGDALFKEQYIINISHIVENIPKYMKKIFKNKI